MPNSPILTCSVVDLNPVTVGLTGDSSVLVRHQSYAKATMYAEAQDGASINMDMCIIRNGSVECNETTHTSVVDTGTLTEHTFLNVPSNTFTFSAEDSNGNVGRATVKPKMVDYIKLTCNTANMRPDGSGNMTVYCSGDCFTGSFGEKDNIVTVQYRYKKSGSDWGGTFSYMTVTLSDNSYIATATVSGLDYKEYYDFQFVAADYFGDTIAESNRVTSLPVFHWGKNDVAFEVPVKLKDSLKITGNGSKWLCFGDNIACSIKGDSDFNMTLSANTLDLEVVNITKEGKSVAFAEYGAWTPTLSISEAICYEQFGWYSKSGDVVTVGFRIKARCYSTIESDIAISGLWEIGYPKRAAAGGGLCSGAIIKTSKNFQCFVAETNGIITTRTQACDSTSGMALETSAIGCKYPIGELTLSGTITYSTN